MRISNELKRQKGVEKLSIQLNYSPLLVNYYFLSRIIAGNEDRK